MKTRSCLPWPKSREEFDEWVIDAILNIVENDYAALTMGHLVALDHAQHDHGTRSPRAQAAFKRTDDLLGKLLARLDLDSTCLMVFGDHGMSDFNRRFSINALFRRKGWIDVRDGNIESWRVLAHINCGQAAVHVKDPFVARDAIKTLREHSEGRYEILERPLLDKLHAFPGVLCAVDCLEGYSMNEALDGDLFFPINATRGEHGHGYRLTHPNRQAGFIMAGPGIAAGARVDSVRLLDLAPLAASILGLPWHAVGMRKFA